MYTTPQFYQCFVLRVAAHNDKNLMTVSNLGVCFGPTLMRPLEETMAAIMDIKWCNLVVEILCEQYEQVFVVMIGVVYRWEYCDTVDSCLTSLLTNLLPRSETADICARSHIIV